MMSHRSTGTSTSSGEEEGTTDSEGESQSFLSFTATIGDRVPAGNPISKQTAAAAQRLRDGHALRRLQKLCDEKTNCDTFMLRGHYNFVDESSDEEDLWYPMLTLSAVGASAVVDTFQRTKTQWKQLQIRNCRVIDPLLQVLGVAKHQDIFRLLEFQNVDHGMLTTLPLLSNVARKEAELTPFKLHGVSMDLACLHLLMIILLETTIIPESIVQPKTTYLQSLEVWNSGNTSRHLNHLEVELLSSALRSNESLVELSLININLSPPLIQSLTGHVSLERLNLSQGCFTQPAIMELGRVLQHSSCQIKSLCLDNCKIITPSRFINPLRTELLANALVQGSCTSLIKLSLRENVASSRDLRHLVRTIHQSCQNLRELDLTQNRIERIIWNHNDLVPCCRDTNESVPPNGSGKNASATSHIPLSTSLSKNFSLQCLWLGRNPILHNRFRSRLASDNAKFEQFLLDFPALGRIISCDQNNARITPFSSKVHSLLWFNHVTRGRLNDGNLPPALWSHVLARISGLADLEMKGLEPDAPKSVLNQIQKRVCQASVIFLLLKHQPSQVTLDACRTVEDEKGNALASTTFSVAPRVRTRKRWTSKVAG